MQLREQLTNFKYCFFSIFILGVILICPCSSIRCYQCGEYNDGVGSITPCINYTDEKHLLECADEKAHCVKYDMDASTVRGCATNCKEKAEKWGTRIYCCIEDACNSTPLTSLNFALLTVVITLLYFQNFDFSSFTDVTIH